jgi:hypothetical protein
MTQIKHNPYVTWLIRAMRIKQEVLPKRTRPKLATARPAWGKKSNTPYVASDMFDRIKELGK